MHLALRASQFTISKEEAREGGKLKFEVYDKDRFSADDFIGYVEMGGDDVLDNVCTKRELWAEENQEYPLRNKRGDVIDAASTLGFALFGDRESIHRVEAAWHLRKKQLESVTASLVGRKWCA